VTNILLVGAGGFAGAILRYLVGNLAQQMSGSTTFPFGTLTVNVIGCFVIGVLAYLARTYNLFSIQAQHLILIGFLGAFTTYSTFGNDTVWMLREARPVPALLYVGAHIVVGFSAVWMGQFLASALIRY